jgi:hypothetical protein
MFRTLQFSTRGNDNFFYRKLSAIMGALTMLSVCVVVIDVQNGAPIIVSSSQALLMGLAV